MLECLRRQAQESLDQVGNGSSSSGLRMTGNRITNRHSVSIAVESGEDLGQRVMFEMLRCFDDCSEDAARFLIKPVAPEARGDQRIVMRPYRAEVVPDRIVARFR